MIRIRISVAFLVLIHAAILAAGFLAPYPYDEHHREYPYQRPGTSVLGPPGEPYEVSFFTGGKLFHVKQPGYLFVLGTDSYGRDVLSRLLYGGRISLLTGLLATAISLSLGLILGTVAGFYGGWIDALVMRSSELLLALPWLYLLLGVRAALPLHISPLQAFFLLIAILGSVGWIRPARIVRGVVLSARERGFVSAARGFGASGFYLMRRHIMPLTAATIITQATILIPQYIVAEVTLSFLGLGVGEPVPSWGNMLSEARQYYSLMEHGWMLAPGVLLVPVLFGYLSIGDYLKAPRDRSSFPVPK